MSDTGSDTGSLAARANVHLRSEGYLPIDGIGRRLEADVRDVAELHPGVERRGQQEVAQVVEEAVAAAKTDKGAGPAILETLETRRNALDRLLNERWRGTLKADD